MDTDLLCEPDISPQTLEGHGLLWFKVGQPVYGPTQGASLEPIAQAIDRAFPQVYKELRRSHHLTKFPLQWWLLEEELFALHAEEEAKGEGNGGEERDEQCGSTKE